jgi:hypothetical protein
MTHTEIRTLIRDADSYAACEALANSGDAVTASKLFLTLVTDLYWKAKDLPAAMSIGSAGVTFGLTRSLVEPDKAIAEQLRGTAKAIAYNLGSFCWPGWGEPGIEIGKRECSFGYDAACCNLRLGTELKRPSKGMGNAYWLVGAYELASRDFDEACASFDKARTTFTEDRAMSLMAAGYRELAAHLQSNGGNTKALDEAKTSLLNEGSEDGKAFADQLTSVESALRDWYVKNA